MKTTEGNRLIAEFMGMRFYHHVSYNTFRNHKGEHIYETTLQYDSSWEWIMPVVELVSNEFTVDIHSYPKHGFSTSIKEGNFRRGYGESENPIKSIWDALVEFIKWHNEQKQ